jgi:AcrR family transcriptional regulator
MTGSEDPRKRLLDAAGQIFGEKGFEGATVREICKQAGVNIAAVNYYFRDKEQLYIETVKHAGCGTLENPPLPEWGPDVPPAARLRDFIHWFVARLMSCDRPAWHTQIMMREMARPTAACAEFVREYVRPTAEILLGILTPLLPPEMPRSKKLLIGFSIVSQCLYHVQNRPVARLLAGEEEYAQFTPDAVANHITEFSLAALGLGPPLGAASPALSAGPADR